MTESVIKRRREQLGLSQESLAEKVGVTAMTVSRWERGEYLPRRKYWSKIEKETGLSPAELVSESAA